MYHFRTYPAANSSTKIHQGASVTVRLFINQMQRFKYFMHLNNKDTLTMKERHTAILTNPKNIHDGHSLILFQDPQAGYGYFYSGIFKSHEPAVIPTTKGESDGYYKSFYRIITYEIPQ